MTALLEVYKCEVCGNMVEMVHTGAGEFVCCGQPMKNIPAGSIDAAKEKHVPVIEKKDDGYHVVVGSTAHPMEERHHIEWIELMVDGKSYTQFLKPGQEPKAFFALTAGKVTVREYCNLHGLWIAEG